MFRQVAEYSVITRQRVGKNSFKPALLALLLALESAVPWLKMLERFEWQPAFDTFLKKNAARAGIEGEKKLEPNLFPLMFIDALFVYFLLFRSVVTSDSKDF